MSISNWWNSNDYGAGSPSTTFLRGCFTDVLNALQRVCRVGTAEDTGSKDDGQGISWHAIGFFLEGNPKKKRGIKREFRGEGNPTTPLPLAIVRWRIYRTILLCPQWRKPKPKTSQVFPRKTTSFFRSKNLSLQWQEVPRCGGCSSTWTSLRETALGPPPGGCDGSESSSLPFAFSLGYFGIEGCLSIPRVTRGCLSPTYRTRWKMRRSKVLRWGRESWSMTEYTPRTVSFLSWRPAEKAPAFRSSFYFFLVIEMIPS